MEHKNILVITGASLALVLPVLFYSFVIYEEPTEIRDSPLFDVQMHNISHLSDGADTVVVGEVEDIGEPQWSTRTGEKPMHVTRNDEIYRNIHIKTEQVLKGEEKDELTIRVRGGERDNITYTAGESPEFEEGERVILFLTDQEDYYSIRGRQIGKMQISEDNKIEREVPSEYIENISPDHTESTPPEFREILNLDEITNEVQ